MPYTYTTKTAQAKARSLRLRLDRIQHLLAEMLDHSNAPNLAHSTDQSALDDAYDSVSKATNRLIDYDNAVGLKAEVEKDEIQRLSSAFASE